jgi:hypothetical protein
VTGTLTDALRAPVSLVQPAAWQTARAEAAQALAGLAGGGAGAGPFRVTEHDVRLALARGGVPADETPFAWSARTARRALGLAAVRAVVAGRARTPVEAVRDRVAESSRLVRAGDGPASGMDRWVAALSPAGRAAVGADAVTWATRLWGALEWDAFAVPPVIGRDHWWDSPHSALLALRSRAEVRTGQAHLVVLSGPRRDSVRAELALVALVEALRAPGGAVPARVVGWWPDSGHLVRADPEPALLTLGVDGVARVLAAVPGRAAA